MISVSRLARPAARVALALAQHVAGGAHREGGDDQREQRRAGEHVASVVAARRAAGASPSRRSGPPPPSRRGHPVCCWASFLLSRPRGPRRTQRSFLPLAGNLARGSLRGAGRLRLQRGDRPLRGFGCAPCGGRSQTRLVNGRFTSLGRWLEMRRTGSACITRSAPGGAGRRTVAPPRRRPSPCRPSRSPRARRRASRPRSSARPAQPQPSPATLPPRHPFMAPNGRSNIHDDAYMSGAYEFPGPLGRDMERLSTFQVAECASVTFDRAGAHRVDLRRASSARAS